MNSKIIFVILFAAVLCFSFGTAVLAQSAPQMETDSATNIQNTYATLTGNLLYPGSYGGTSVYFQWGSTTSYNYQTTGIMQNYSGVFSQTISGLEPNTFFHFRAVAQNNYGTVYGQDMTFSTSGSGYYTGYYNGNNNYGNGVLTINKQVLNLSSGNLSWQTSVNAKPSDILSFAVTLQANGQDIHNVVVRDILPVNLIYKGNLTVNTNSNYGGDITSGVNIGTVYAGQSVVVAYQAQVASASSFSYGSTTINNNATVTSSEAGTQTSAAEVIVSKTLVYGASSVSTGLTNNFWTDSFFLPLLIIVLGLLIIFNKKRIIGFLEP